MDQKGDPAGHEHRVQGLLRGHESQIADRDLQRSLVRPVFSAQFHVLNGRIGRRSHVFKLGQHRPKRSMVFKLVGVGCIVADIEQVADVVEQSRRRSLCFRRNVVVSRQHDGIGEIGEPSESRAVRHAFGLHPDMLGMLLVQGFLVDGLRAFEHAMHIRDELRIVEDVRIVVAEAARQASPGGDAHGIAGFSTLNGADVVAGGCRQGILGTYSASRGYRSRGLWGPMSYRFSWALLNVECRKATLFPGAPDTAEPRQHPDRLPTIVLIGHGPARRG